MDAGLGGRGVLGAVCNFVLSTSKGIAGTQFQIPAMPPATKIPPKFTAPSVESTGTVLSLAFISSYHEKYLPSAGNDNLRQLPVAAELRPMLRRWPHSHHACGRITNQRHTEATRECPETPLRVQMPCHVRGTLEGSLVHLHLEGAL
jgi:hypothetical protein